METLVIEFDRRHHTNRVTQAPETIVVDLETLEADYPLAVTILGDLVCFCGSVVYRLEPTAQDGSTTARKVADYRGAREPEQSPYF